MTLKGNKTNFILILLFEGSLAI